MMGRISLALAVAVALVPACSKDGGHPNIPEVAPASVPVLVQVELPSGNGLGSAGAVLDAVQPGAAAQAAAMLPSALASAAGVSSLAGANLDAPVRALVLDPKQHPQPVLLLVSVSDAKQLEQAVGKDRLTVKDELALVGAADAARKAHDYAFGTLARRQAPGAPRAVVYMEPVMSSFRAEIEAAKGQLGVMVAMMSGGAGGEGMTKVLQAYIDGVVAMAGQTERVEASFVQQDALSGVEITLHPRPDTLLAGFVKAQKPADLSMLGALPAGARAPGMVMAGDMVLGPARAPVVELAEQLVAAMWGGVIDEEMRGMIEPWMDLFSGRFAVAITALGMQPDMVQLIEVSDSAQAAAYSRKFMEALTAKGATLDIMGVKQTIAFTPEAFEHQGVSVMEQRTTMEIAGASDEERAALEAAGATDTRSYFAGVGDYLAMITGEPDAMRGLIDAVRGQAPRLEIEGALARAVDTARARQDSALMFMDLKTLLQGIPAGPASEAPESIVMTLGFPDGRMRMFLAAGR